MGEDIATRIGSSGQLNNEGGKYVAAVLFAGVPKVAVKISNRGQPAVA
jgi:hypothetical protein